MDLLLTHEEKLLQQTVRQFANKELIPRAAHIDEHEEFSWDNWKGLASLGLTGLGLDPVYGGSGGNYRQLVIATEQIARGCASTSVGFAAHLSLTAHTIARFGTEEQKRRLLPPMAQGEKIGAWALSEPACGSDAAALQTIARSENDGYYLNGAKTFISNGDIADHIVIFATRNRNLRSKGVSAFIADKDFPGLSAHKQRGKLGMRGSSTAAIYLDNCRIPAENRLGEEGQGFNQAMEVLNSSRIIIASQAVGIAQASFEAASAHSLQRRSFGRSLSEHQAIQFMIADMATAVYASKVMTLTAATLRDQQLPFVSEAAMAKLFASESAVRLTSQALQIHGGYGYFKGAPVERYFRDARVTTIYEGTSEIQRLIIARNVLKDFVS